MVFTISDNTKGIMDDLDNGTAFDTSLQTNLGTLNSDFSAFADPNSLGSFSPSYLGLQSLTDTTPFDATDLVSEVGANGNALSSDVQSALVGLPKGVTAAFQSHVASHFAGLTDNMSIYASSQSVQNALGNSTGCNDLTGHFGSILATGQASYAEFFAAKNDISSTITDFSQVKTQVQSEINNLDTNAIGLLTGKVNNTILGQVVHGSGLFDQIDNIMVASGYTKNSADAQSILGSLGTLLTPGLNNFYNKKTGVNAAVAAATSKRGGVLDMIGGELTTINKATTTLRTLGAANAASSLFKSNECIQTLLGFVGTDGFIGKLGV